MGQTDAGRVEEATGWEWGSPTQGPILSSCVTLEKSLNLPEPQFSHLKLGMIIPAVSLVLDGRCKDNLEIGKK